MSSDFLIQRRELHREARCLGHCCSPQCSWYKGQDTPTATGKTSNVHHAVFPRTQCVSLRISRGACTVVSTKKFLMFSLPQCWCRNIMGPEESNAISCPCRLSFYLPVGKCLAMFCWQLLNPDKGDGRPPGNSCSVQLNMLWRKPWHEGPFFQHAVGCCLSRT